MAKGRDWKDCPFEQGVLYMPVPRCDQCRFWKRNPPPPPNTSGLLQGWGECVLFSDDSTLAQSRPDITNHPEQMATVCPFAGADGAGFDTQADFGCVQFEAK